MSATRTAAHYDSEGLLDKQRVARHYSSSAHHVVAPHSHYFNPMYSQDQSAVTSRTGREHLARTRKITEGHVLATPNSNMKKVPLRDMMTWHQGRPETTDDEQEWAVEHLTPGRGMVKRTCRKFGMHHWTPDSVGYTHNGFLAKVQKMKADSRQNQGAMRGSVFL